jgi:hypothetical protein
MQKASSPDERRNPQWKDLATVVRNWSLETAAEQAAGEPG